MTVINKCKRCEGSGERFLIEDRDEYEGYKTALKRPCHECNATGRDVVSVECPEVGTLKEIGAKVGDVVECEWRGDGDWQKYTWVKSHPKYGWECMLCCRDGSGYIRMEDMHQWSCRIISRAQPGPVRTVTTTRQEIVPGVYGRLRVSKSITDSDDVCIDIVGGMVFSQHELTAIISTLQTIRDAMQANTTAWNARRPRF